MEKGEDYGFGWDNVPSNFSHEHFKSITKVKFPESIPGFAGKGGGRVVIFGEEEKGRTGSEVTEEGV